MTAHAEASGSEVRIIYSSLVSPQINTVIEKAEALSLMTALEDYFGHETNQPHDGVYRYRGVEWWRGEPDEGIMHRRPDGVIEHSPTYLAFMRAVDRELGNSPTREAVSAQVRVFMDGTKLYDEMRTVAGGDQWDVTLKSADVRPEPVARVRVLIDGQQVFSGYHVVNPDDTWDIHVTPPNPRKPPMVNPELLVRDMVIGHLIKEQGANLSQALTAVNSTLGDMRESLSAFLQRME